MDGVAADPATVQGDPTAEPIEPAAAAQGDPAADPTEPTEPTEPTAAGAPGPAIGGAVGLDDEALYRRERNNMRVWEKRAKAEAARAEGLRAEADGLSAATAEAHAAAEAARAEIEATKRAAADARAAAEAAEAMAAARRRVSRDTGIPAEFLHGDTPEAVEALGYGMKRYFGPPPAPAVKGAGMFPREVEDRTDKQKLADQIFNGGEPQGWNW